MPKLNLEEHYGELWRVSGSILESVFGDSETKSALGKSHALLSDIHSIIDVTAQRPESAMFKAAALEYQYGLYAVSTGAYRHAYLSLRLTLELSLNAFLFSAHEIRYQQWKNGSRDVSWAAIVDENEGLFSKPFFVAFCPPLADMVGQYRALATATYRECSEYVHGNPHTHTAVGETVKFQKSIIENWHSLAESVRLLLLFCYCGRFGILHDEESKTQMRDAIDDTFSHVAEIRALFTK